MTAPLLLHGKQYSSEGPPLLILHGLFGSLTNWNWQSRELAGQFAVTALDLRNHGSSFHLADMNYPLMADDVRHYLDAQGIDDCFLLGHSMGGKVGMQLALDHPQRIRRLAVVDIAPVDYSVRHSGHEEVFAALAALDLDRLESRNDADQLLEEYLPDKSLRQFLLSNLQRNEQGSFAWKFNLPALQDNYARLREQITTENRFDRPVLFIKGDDSPYIGEEHRERIMSLFPQAQVKIIMGAGHWVHADKPQVFNKIVADFFSREDSTP